MNLIFKTLVVAFVGLVLLAQTAVADPIYFTRQNTAGGWADRPAAALLYGRYNVGPLRAFCNQRFNFSVIVCSTRRYLDPIPGWAFNIPLPVHVYPKGFCHQSKPIVVVGDDLPICAPTFNVFAWGLSITQGNVYAYRHKPWFWRRHEYHGWRYGY